MNLLRFIPDRHALAALSLVLAPFVAWAADAPSADLVTRGAYLANAGDCIACHTAKGGKPLAGGLYMNTPFGAISTPNITPDKATGIGAWTDEQFYRAVHDGIGHKGEYLYPVMPFPWYSIVTRDDVMAIRAYLNTQPAVHQARPPNKLGFPYSIARIGELRGQLLLIASPLDVNAGYSPAMKLIAAAVTAQREVAFFTVPDMTHDINCCGAARARYVEALVVRYLGDHLAPGDGR